MRPFVFLALALIVPAGCNSDSGISDASPPTVAPQAIFHSGADAGSSSAEVVLYLEVARTQKERSQGLMGRTDLAPDQGMLFVWETPTQSPFWMKNTPLPLSIAFVSNTGVIIDIQDMEPLSLDQHKPGSAYSYAIEANRGFFESAGIRAGEQVRFSGV
ncbi:MAG: DUF192 domain-containing protein [Thermoleophilia bacterium]